LLATAQEGRTIPPRSSDSVLVEPFIQHQISSFYASLLLPPFWVSIRRQKSQAKEVSTSKGKGKGKGKRKRRILQSERTERK
jgi:hypothetical protein